MFRIATQRLQKQEETEEERPLTVLRSAQVKDQQVGDALVLGERQAGGWFGLAARLSMPIHTIDMAINSIYMTVYSIWDIVAYREVKRSKLTLRWVF